MMDDVSQSLFQTPLIGRAAELEELRRLTGVDDALAAGAVLLGVDAGVGKTRILAELRDTAVLQGRRTMVGHCVDFGDTAPPYLPFAEMFARLATEDPEAAAQLAKRHPAVSRLAFRNSDGAAPIDRGALVDVAVRLSALADDLPEIGALHLRPVLAGPGGIAVTGATGRIGPPPARPDERRRLA